MYVANFPLQATRRPSRTDPHTHRVAMLCSNGLAATSLRILLAVSGADTSQPTAAVNDCGRLDPGTVTALTPSDVPCPYCSCTTLLTDPHPDRKVFCQSSFLCSADVECLRSGKGSLG